jgi:hypothetical protein
MILDVFLPSIVPVRPLRAIFQPEEAEFAHNFFPWMILQGTLLFSGFCSASLSVSQRKQGFCLQNMGGGYPRAGTFSGCQRPAILCTAGIRWPRGRG